MTSIEWTHRPGTKGESWNPVFGCTPKSPGCANCYAERMAHRLAGMAKSDVVAGRNPGVKAQYLRVLNSSRKWNGDIVCDNEVLLKPLSWRAPRTIFVCSMADLFHEDVPFEFIDKVFAVMALCPQHTFQVLTKRPERMAEYFEETSMSVDERQTCVATALGNMLDGEWIWNEGKLYRESIERRIADLHEYDDDEGEYEHQDIWPLPNVGLGTSVENNDYRSRIDDLIQCPAAVRFLSLEPLLGPIDLWESPTVDWVIVGGESGFGARPCSIDDIGTIVNQSAAANVPVFVKQLGAFPVNARGYPIKLKDSKGGDMAEWPEDLRVREFPSVGEVRSE